MSFRGRRDIAFALVGAALTVAATGCGDRAPPPPELPGFEIPRGPAELTVTLHLTFTRDEAPVVVFRTVQVPLDQEPDADGALLLDMSMTELVRGPTSDERDDGIFSFFSEEAGDLLLAVDVVGDSAMVDFRDLRPAIPNASSSTGSFILLSELNGTVFALPGIARVEYRMEGSCEAFWNFLQRSCQEVGRPAPA